MSRQEIAELPPVTGEPPLLESEMKSSLLKAMVSFFSQKKYFGKKVKKKVFKCKNVFFFFQFNLIRRRSNYQEPYVTPTCPGQCSASYTLDYRKYCTCPILYFVLSPEYVRHLPHFNGNFYSGLLANIPTDPTMTDSPVTPLLRPSRKSSLFVLLSQVCFSLDFWFLREKMRRKNCFTYFFCCS